MKKADDMTHHTEEFSYETIANLRTSLHETERKLSRVVKAADECGLNSIALDVAKAIDDIYAQGHATMAQRLARVQSLIREEMRANLTGATDWRYTSVVSRP